MSESEMTGEKQLLQRMYVDEVDQPYITTHMYKGRKSWLKKV